MTSRRHSVDLSSFEEGRGPHEEPGPYDGSVPNTGNRQSTSQGGDASDETAMPVVGEPRSEAPNVGNGARSRGDPPSTHNLYTKPAQSKPSKTDITGWDYVYDRLRLYDQEMIKGYSQDIDNLLIFAGLFSAVLTAFLVEVYTQLQPDNTQLSVQLLSNISLQLQQISLNQAAPASVEPLNMSFQADSHVVAINMLWFLSLILALASALLGIFVKQWLREYMAWPNISPVQHAIQLRKFRYDAFHKWKVPAIVTLVPGLLQLAVVLFFGGLVTLLWPIDIIVSGVCCAAAGLTISLASLTVLLPLFFETCPYKTPFGWMIRPILRPFYRMIRPFVSSLYLWNWPDRLKAIKEYCWNCRYPVPDMYAFDGWDHRDLALRCFGRDSESSIAYQFHSLLWLASHEELGDDVIARCISASPGPRVRTRSALQRVDNSWPVKPERRIRGYWKAISELFGMPCVGPTIPALDILDKACIYDFGQGTSQINHAKLCDAFASLTSFNDTQVLLISELLRSGLDTLLPDAMSTITNTSDLYSKSLVMILFIATQNDRTHVPCVNFLLKNLTKSDESDLTDANENISAIFYGFRDKIRFIYRELKDMTDMLELACSCYDRAAFRSAYVHRDRFWTAVSCVTNTEADEGIARAQRYTESFKFQRWRMAMSAFGDCLIDALSLWTDPGDGEHGAEGGLRIHWYNLVRFLECHREFAPGCSWKVTRFILEAHRRGSFPNEDITSAIIYFRNWRGAYWDDAEDVYKHFGLESTMGSRRVAGPSSGPRQDAPLHSNSVLETVSKPSTCPEPIIELVLCNDGSDGIQPNHRVDASNVLSTSTILQMQGTNSGSIRAETREPGAGQERIEVERGSDRNLVVGDANGARSSSVAEEG